MLTADYTSESAFQAGWRSWQEKLLPLEDHGAAAPLFVVGGRVKAGLLGGMFFEDLGFRYIGRQRQCHVIDGRAYDRLLFDLLAEEFTARDDYRRHRRERSRRDGVQPGEGCPAAAL